MNGPMDTMEIRTYPDSVLRESAVLVEEIDDDIRALIDRMVSTMCEAPGIGLAANQVGVLKQIIVFDLYPSEENREPCALVNPEIIKAEGTIVYEEACLSVVDFSAEVTRNEAVMVRGVGRDGEEKQIDADGLLAVCLQHEIDHLQGKLFIDHISNLKRSMYKKKLKKRLKET